MSIDHVTLLQIDRGLARIYAYEYEGSSGRIYHIKHEGYLPIVENQSLYGLVRSGTDGKISVVRILADVTDTFRPQEDIKYNWLIDTFSNYIFAEHAQKYEADRIAERRLESAQAMQKVRALQAHISIDILTGLPNTPSLSASEVFENVQDDGYSSHVEDTSADDTDTEPKF